MSVDSEGESALAVDTYTHQPVHCEHRADGAPILVVLQQPRGAAECCGAIVAFGSLVHSPGGFRSSQIELQLWEGTLNVFVIVGERIMPPA